MSDDIRIQLFNNFKQKSTDELIEIWQSNNRVEWSEMTFDVIREILRERLVDLPLQTEANIEVANKDIEKEKLEGQNEKMKFNWKYPVLGAIGFGIGFTITDAIMLTIYNIAQNTFAQALGEVKVGIETGALRGLILGGVGGAGLGLAQKDKTRAYFFALAGAIGFGIALALVISIDSFLISEIGQAIIRLFGGPVGFLSLETALARGLGIGIIIGAIGGSVLGLAPQKYRAISVLLLCFAGIFSFGNIFAFGCTIFDGNFFSLWNTMGGVLVGTALGAALALYYMIADSLTRKQN